jgi:hypothetical protein
MSRTSPAANKRLRKFIFNIGESVPIEVLGYSCGLVSVSEGESPLAVYIVQDEHEDSIFFIEFNNVRFVTSQAIPVATLMKVSTLRASDDEPDAN